MRYLLCGLLILGAAVDAFGEQTRLLRRPTVSREHVAFAHAGDLWRVRRSGGQAQRLTATADVETDPYFSPDGSRIAFTAVVRGNTDVYVVAADGGEPTRLTFHPGLDAVRGWTPDGARVVFGSSRGDGPTPGANFSFRLWTIALAGGLPQPLVMPRAFTGSYSPDGTRIAYEEVPVAFTPQWAQNQSSQWRHYRGGRTHPIRLLTLAGAADEKLPWGNSNDTQPMWLGEAVYFLSDRNGTTNLFSYTPATKQLTQLTRHDDFDIMNASAGAGAVVYEQAGDLHLFDAATKTASRLAIEIVGDRPWARPRFQRVGAMIRNAALSPTGVRVAFEARGEILTVPAEKGDFRNLTQSPGAHDRSPVWSPNGAEIAWLSDTSGEYQLLVAEQGGAVKPRAIALPANTFFSSPIWSPNGKYLLLEDNQLRLWTVDIATGQAKTIETDTYDEPDRRFDAAWSPDSQWVTYSKSLDSHLRAVFVHSLPQGRSFQVTDGLSDATSPRFDAAGKYLYFFASTNFALRTGYVEMSSVERPTTRAIYLAVLSASEPSPFLPETGDEPVVSTADKPADSKTAPAPPSADGKADAPGTVTFDPDGIGQRILALNVAAGEYGAPSAGPAGTLYYTEAPRAASPGAPAPLTLHRYQLSTRRPAVVLEGIRSYQLSPDKKKILYQADGQRWGVVPTDRPAKVGEGVLDLARVEIWVDPPAEWAQIFRETWRIQRDFFYDAKMHGANWDAIYKKYSPLVPFVGHRQDLSYLIATMGGELAVGHSYVTDAPPDEEPVAVGMLGADYAIENGRYRLRRVYSGENWNPELQAPLSAPGVQVAEGDYLLEINGRPLVPPESPYERLQGTAGRQTVLRVSRTPSMEGSRLITVVPVASEDGLRARAWIEGNRRLVDKLSGGRLAYVWLPNTGLPGYTAFNRYYYAQQEKDGAIIDERYNQGGMVADYIVNELDRRLMGYFARRSGKPTPSPAAGIYGPKVMIVNESAGSGGDALPYYFKQRKLGPLVGTRTWGALVGTLPIPTTIDGGGITAPSLAFYDLQGRWAVENEGIAPDIEVENTPASVAAGHDLQLERAVQEALKLLEQQPIRRVPRPAPPNRVSPPRPPQR